MSTVTKEYESIRPAGRLMLTIGRDLIKSPSSALLELVKNAYDADAPDVTINMMADRAKKSICIVVEDHGHGMTNDVVKNIWLVPATGDKLRRKKSPKGRVMQGRKGVGRFASAILGDGLLLETVADSVRTSVELNWNEFEDVRYLDQVKIPILKSKVKSGSGTKLTITGGEDYLEQWSEKQLDHVIYELKKLVPPELENEVDGKKQRKRRFEIKVRISGFGDKDRDEVLKPFPLVELYDYRIAGVLHADGRGTFTYSCNCFKNQQDEKIIGKYKPTGCGELSFDIRVYDRDRSAIEKLIARGLRDDHGEALAYQEAIRLLNSACGIGVYRNGFRISPLGDPEYDWLELNKKRVQSPALCIGSDQVIGYIAIESEEESNLIEKSARDGLRENVAYAEFKRCAAEIIKELEVRRYRFRKDMGYGRVVQKLGQRLSAAFGYAEFRKKIVNRLRKEKASKEAVDDIQKLIDEKEDEQAKLLEDLNASFAVYQGQATLGKIMNVVLHEGRRPLNYLTNQIPNLRFFHDEYVKTKDEEDFSEVDRLLDGTVEQVQCFTGIFDKIDPLAVSKRKCAKQERLSVIIEDSRRVFEDPLRRNKISCDIDCDPQLKFACWRQDMQAIFVNLIENSIFWIVDKEVKVRKITIRVKTDEKGFPTIDYRDTGPGIDKEHIESGIIFDPGFSTKTEGTGLGLAIAGEAAQRNGLQVKALENASGAYFRIEPKKSEKETT